MVNHMLLYYQNEAQAKGRGPPAKVEDRIKTTTQERNRIREIGTH